MATFDEFYAQAKQRVPSASLEDIRTAYSRMTGNEPILQQGPTRKQFEERARALPSLATVSKDDIDSAYDQIYGGGGIGSELYRSAKRGLVGLGVSALGIGEAAKDTLGQLPAWMGNAGLAGAAMNADGLPDIAQARRDLQEYQQSIPRSAASQGDVTKDLSQSLLNPLWWAGGAPEMIASQVPVIAGFAAGGPLGAGLVGAGMEGQSTYATAKDEGLENPGARGLGMGLAAGALNAIPFLGNAGRGVLPMAGRMLKESITEWAEEIPGAFLEAPVDQWNSATLQEGLRRGANIAPLAALGGAMNGLGNPSTNLSDSLVNQINMAPVGESLAAPMPTFQPPQPVAQQAPAPVDFGSLAGQANNIASTLDSRRKATSVAELAATLPPAPTVDPVEQQAAEQKFQAEQTAALETRKTDVSQIIAPIVSKWKGAPGIKVVGTYEELPDEIKAKEAPGLDALYDGRGNVWMVADQLKDRVQVEKRLLHESLGHYGIEQIVGGKKELDTFSADVLRFATKDKQFAEILDGVRKAYVNEKWTPEQRDHIHGLEVVAKYSENHPNNKHPLMERIYASLRQFARKMGVKVHLNRADLNRMLRISMRNLEQGGQQGVMSGEAKASKQALVVNSQGRPVYPTAEGQQNFINWFTGKEQNGQKNSMAGSNTGAKNRRASSGIVESVSKVVDAKGRPQVVYHGSPELDDNGEPIDVFGGADYKFDHQKWMTVIGDWFTDSPSVANHFAERGFEGVVYPAYLRISNPYTVSTYSQLESAYEKSKAPSIQSFRDSLIKKGFDGIIIERSTTDTGELRRDFVPFGPSQIKSATGNSGDFSPSNPSIKASRPLQEELPGVPAKPERDAVMEGIELQLRKITGLTPEARKLMLDIAAQDKDKLVARGRGVRSWDVTNEAAQQLASDLGYDGVQALYDSPLGMALNAEQLTLAASDLQQAAETAAAYNQQVLSNASPENQILYKAALESLQLRLAAFRGFSTEAGRALNILNQAAGLVTNINQLFEAYVPNNTSLMKMAERHAAALKQDNTPAVVAITNEIAQTNQTGQLMAEQLKQANAQRAQTNLAITATEEQIALLESVQADNAAAKEQLKVIRGKLRSLRESEKKLAEREASIEQGIKQIDAKKTELAARRKKIKRGGTSGKLIQEWKPTVGDMLLEYFYSNILSGPATHMANIIGNTAFGVLEEAAKQGVLRVSGHSAEANARIRAMQHGAMLGFRNAKLAFKMEEPIIDQQTKLDHQSRRAIPDMLGGRFWRLPTRALLAEDEFFKGMAYTMQLAEIAYRKSEGNQQAAQQIIDNPTFEEREEALTEARRLTFTSKLGQNMSAVQQLINRVKPLKLVVPFVQTPTNLLYRAMDWSPLGLLGVMHKGTNISKDMRGENGPIKQRIAFTRQTMGGALLMLGWEMAAQGLLIGNGPPDPEDKAIYLGSMGAKDAKMFRSSPDGEWVSFNRFDPLAIPLAIIADMHYAATVTKEMEAKEIGLLLLSSFTTNMADKTWLNGVSTAVEALARPEQSMEYFVGNIASGMVPTNAMAQTLAANDPYVKDARGIMDRIWSRIPGLRNGLANKVDIRGEETENTTATIAGMAMPWKTGSGVPDPVMQKMVEVGFSKGVPEREMLGVKLEADEYHDWKIAVQSIRWRAMQQLVSNPNFSRFTKEYQKEQMEKVWDQVTGSSRFGQMLKMQFLMEHPRVRAEYAKKRAAG